MNPPKKNPSERQIDTEAEDHAQETLYAVTHGGRELHPEQKENPACRPDSSRKNAEMPWQID